MEAGTWSAYRYRCHMVLLILDWRWTQCSVLSTMNDRVHDVLMTLNIHNDLRLIWDLVVLKFWLALCWIATIYCSIYLILFCICGQPELRGCEQLMELFLLQYYKIGFCSHKGCVYIIVMWYASSNGLVNLKLLSLTSLNHYRNMWNIWKQPSRQEEQNSVMEKVIPIAAAIRLSVMFCFFWSIIPPLAAETLVWDTSDTATA